MRTDVLTRALRATYVAVLATLAVIGCRKQETVVERKASLPERVKVNSVPIVKHTVPSTFPMTGTLNADLRAELTASSSGRVLKTYVERGQKVTKGAILFQLDVRAAAASAAEAQASVASAKTQLSAARTECERYDALIARGAITRQEHDRQTAICTQQQAATVVTEARSASALLVVGDATIRAPFTGVITERLVNVGDYVNSSTMVATLVVSKPLRLKLTVPEHRIGQVEVGALVTFSSVALPERVFSGTVKYIGGEVRPSTRDVIVEAIVQNDDGALMPGMFVDARMRTGEVSLPIVPNTSLFAMGYEMSLYVVKNGRLEQRIVKVGAKVGEFVAVESGAGVGEFVVLNPPPTNSDGAPIL